MEDGPTRRHSDSASDVVELIRQQHDLIRSLLADVAAR